MRITHIFKVTSNQAMNMRRELNYYPIERDIYSAYNNPSGAKVCAYYSILNTYEDDNRIHDFYLHNKFIGRFRYNGNLRVTGCSSHFFSTIATFINLDTNQIVLVKETHCNTYMCALEEDKNV